jgi:hypothetical protein
MMQQAPPSPQGNHYPEVQMTPFADREIRKARDDYARAVSSGQFDEIQLEELWNKTDEYVGRLRQSASEDVPQPQRDSLQQEFEANVLPFDGKLIQKDPETGRFEVLSEPVKDARMMEEMQFQQKLDVQKGRIDLMKSLMGLSSGTTAEGGKKPMYTPDQVRAEVDRMLPETTAEGGGGQITPEQFDQQWAQLPSGGTLTGPDGKTYRKK